MSRADRDRAYAELSKAGEFIDGKYTWLDADGNSPSKDALNAIWEHVFNRESSFPEPRYPQPILMDPDAFEYVESGDGVQRKVLGRFTERDLTITKVRWSDRAKYAMPDDRTYCMFTNAGTVEIVVEGGVHRWGDLDDDVDTVRCGLPDCRGGVGVAVVDDVCLRRLGPGQPSAVR